MGANEVVDADEDATGEFLVAIFDDVRKAERDLKGDDAPFRRRAYVRATFSSVEGFIFIMKKMALGKPNLFSQNELAILREEPLVAGPANGVRVRPRFLPIGDNLRFAFGAFMRSHGSTAVLPTDEGWNDFTRAIGIRNRVTHPKSNEDLQIGDEDIEIVRRAAHWLVMYVLMSVVETMGPGAVTVVGLFLVLWGLVRHTRGSSSPTARPEARETD
jgi:hypothetical protein